MSGIGEFEWGAGLHPPLGVDPGGNGGAVVSPYDRLRATRMTESTNPDASEDDVWSASVTQSEVDEDGMWVAGTLRTGTTVPVTETGPAPSDGQHRIIHTDRYNPASDGRPKHYADGYQDGEGEAWRASIPPNPVL